MPAPIAALGLNQLNKINFYNECRRQAAKRWDLWCERNGYQKPLVVQDSVPVYLRYPVLVEPRKKQNPDWANNKLGVDIGGWFTGNIHTVHPLKEGYPEANKAVRQCINFPCLYLAD